jgi:hypothetical protein
MDFVKAIVRRQTADQDAELATNAEQAAAYATVSSVNAGSTDLLGVPPATARSLTDNADSEGACTAAPDLEAQHEDHSRSDTQAECRICLSAGSTDQELFQPCACAGTMGYTHPACLAAWVQEKGSLTCELCKQRYKEPYVQALAFSIRASWGQQQQQQLQSQPQAQQSPQQRPAALGVEGGGEARQAVSSRSTCCGCILRMTVGQWFCIL